MLTKKPLKLFSYFWSYSVQFCKRNLYTMTKLQHSRIGFQNFWGADLIIDKISNITTTIQNHIHRGGYHLDFRGMTQSVNLDQELQGWEVEYFCENEGIISTKVNDKWRTSYYAYLNSKLDWFIDLNIGCFCPSSFWSPGMGGFHSFLPLEVNCINSIYPSVSIHDNIRIQEGSNIAHSITEIGNPSADFVDYIYVYQDAAYLWFPRGNQESVVPFLGYLNSNGLLTIYYAHQGTLICDENMPLIFSGNVDFAHGVCTALFSVTPASRVGNIDRYIGFEKQIVVDGIAYAVLDKDNPTTLDHQPAEYIDSCADTSTSFLRSIFFWIDGSLNSYETKKHDWGRLMMHKTEGFKSESEVTGLISNMLNKYKRSV